MAKDQGQVGVLLVNLGTPSEPSPKAVRAYLKEFLSDRRVIDYPRWLWYPILYGVILPIRSKKSAAKYRTIWTEQGSPLRLHTDSLAKQLEKRLAARQIPVATAMTYGEPSLEQGLLALRRCQVDKVVVLPLFPQFSGTTTAAVFDGIYRSLAPCPSLPQLRMVRDYHDHPQFIQALAGSVKQHWQRQGQGDHLLLSFHGIPERYVRRGDPYQRQCQATASLLAAALGLNENQWTLSYQSRVGKEKWLAPYTDATLAQLAQQGVERLDVICPAFATDCLETLEEIADEGRETFLEAGGSDYRYIPALNSEPAQVELLASLVLNEAQGWLTSQQRVAIQ